MRRRVGIIPISEMKEITLDKYSKWQTLYQAFLISSS